MFSEFVFTSIRYIVLSGLYSEFAVGAVCQIEVGSWPLSLFRGQVVSETG